MNISKLIFICFVVSLTSISTIQAKQININNTGDWVSKLSQLKPGDTAVLKSGRFSTGSYSGRAKTISISGTNSKPIIIRGAGPGNTTLDGEGSFAVLIFEKCNNVIIENLTVTNPSRSADGRSKRIKVNSQTLAEGFILRGGNNITIRNILFNNIGTRGIFTQPGFGPLKSLVIEKSLFFNIGNDTASGDINMNSGENWTIRYNLFAGNVDGIVNAGRTTGGGLIEQNIFINHWQEDNIDIKGHRGSKQTKIRKNVFYMNRSKTGITIQNSSRDITIDNNVFYHGAPVGQIWIHGRNHSNGKINEPVKNITIINNVLYGDNKKEDRGIMVQQAKNKGKTHSPVPVLNIGIRNNYILAHQKNHLVNRVGNNVRQSNNNFSSLPQSRKQQFINLEKSILKTIESIFSQSIIQEAFNEAKVPYAAGSGAKNSSLEPPVQLRIF